MNTSADDYHQNDFIKPGINQSTLPQAYFNFLKAVMGIGILVLPYASAHLGTLTLLTILLILGFSSMRSNQLLVQVADHVNLQFAYYSDIARASLRGEFARLVDVSIVVGAVGICVAYIIFFIEAIIEVAADLGYLLFPNTVAIFSMLFVVPLMLIRNLHYFHLFSGLGFVLGLFALLLAMLDSLVNYPIAQQVSSNLISTQGTLTFLGVSMLAFDGSTCLLPIRESMASKQEFKHLPSIVINTVLVISVLAALLCGKGYGPNQKEIVLLNISDPTLKALAMGAYGISLLISYPLQLFPANQIIETQLLELEEGDGWIVDKIRLKARMAIACFILLLAIYVPSITLYLGLLGCVLSAMLLYMLPVIIHRVYFLRDTSQRAYELTYLGLWGLGCGAMIFGTIHNLIEISQQMVPQSGY